VACAVRSPPVWGAGAIPLDTYKLLIWKDDWVLLGSPNPLIWKAPSYPLNLLIYKGIVLGPPKIDLPIVCNLY